MKNRKRILKNALSNDTCVRRELAEKLAGNSSEEAQIILKFLSHDKNALVRAEAFPELLQRKETGESFKREYQTGKE